MNTDNKEKQKTIEHDALAPFVFGWFVFLCLALMLLGVKIFFGLVALYAAKETIAAGDRELKRLRERCSSLKEETK